MTTRDDWTERFQQRFENREVPATPKKLKLTPYTPSERDVLASVLEFLQLHPQVGKVWRQNTGSGRLVHPDGTSQYIRFGFVGCPDILGFMATDGRALFVEVKAEGGHKSDAQLAFMQRAKQAGCVAFFASSVSDAVDALREFGYSRIT